MLGGNEGWADLEPEIGFEKQRSLPNTTSGGFDFSLFSNDCHVFLDSRELFPVVLFFSPNPPRYRSQPVNRSARFVGCALCASRRLIGQTMALDWLLTGYVLRLWIGRHSRSALVTYVQACVACDCPLVLQIGVDFWRRVVHAPIPITVSLSVSRSTAGCGDTIARLLV